MPEAAVNEDDYLMLTEDNVGSPWQPCFVKTESKSLTMKPGAD